MPTYDTIVIGAGVIGSAAARTLAASGSVLLLEQFPFLHERGSSHGGSRIFRHAYVDELHTRLAVRADALWQDLEAETGERLLYRTGGVDLFEPHDRQADAMLAALAAASSPGQRLSGAELRRRYPVFALPDDKVVVYHPASAILPATRAVATLLRSAAARGATLRESEPVTRISPSASGVTVTTQEGEYHAGHVVLAAGGWLGRLAASARLPLVVEQQQIIYLPVTGQAAAHAVGQMPVFIERVANGAGGIYGFPTFEYPHAIKVADNGGARAIPSAEERDFQLDAALASSTIAAATALLPGIGATPTSSATCLYTKTPDERFVVDRHPEHRNVVLAGGGSGHAFKFGPLLGDLIAELVNGAEPIKELRADRFGA
ncbi:MAG TPA: N-methyl-L-tryptophan oxidase [Trueperaceae bacterium]|nr:N-methyl-L-tryptophan oxidase [Trueperaceae bacterium]